MSQLSEIDKYGLSDSNSSPHGVLPAVPAGPGHRCSHFPSLLPGCKKAQTAAMPVTNILCAGTLSGGIPHCWPGPGSRSGLLLPGAAGDVARPGELSAGRCLPPPLSSLGPPHSPLLDI